MTAALISKFIATKPLGEPFTLRAAVSKADWPKTRAGRQKLNKLAVKHGAKALVGADGFRLYEKGAVLFIKPYGLVVKPVAKPVVKPVVKPTPVAPDIVASAAKRLGALIRTIRLVLAR
jgi:hypothetical protein